VEVVEPFFVCHAWGYYSFPRKVVLFVHIVGFFFFWVTMHIVGFGCQLACIKACLFSSSSTFFFG
jgi:hypothetical protein